MGSRLRLAAVRGASRVIGCARRDGLSFSLRSLSAALIMTGLPVMGVGPAHGATIQHTTAPPFPDMVSEVREIAQLIGPPPASPEAPYAPSPHSLNDTTRWGICSWWPRPVANETDRCIPPDNGIA